MIELFREDFATQEQPILLPFLNDNFEIVQHSSISCGKIGIFYQHLTALSPLI